MSVRLWIWDLGYLKACSPPPVPPDISFESARTIYRRIVPSCKDGDNVLFAALSFRASVGASILPSCVSKCQQGAAFEVVSDRLVREEVEVRSVQFDASLFSNWCTLVEPLKLQWHSVCAFSKP